MSKALKMKNHSPECLYDYCQLERRFIEEQGRTYALSDDLHDVQMRLIDSRTRERIAVKALKEYGLHTGFCILNKYKDIRKNDKGEYECRYAGNWYQVRPIDETPKCDCGLAEAPAKIEALKVKE